MQIGQQKEASNVKGFIRNACARLGREQAGDIADKAMLD